MGRRAQINHSALEEVLAKHPDGLTTEELIREESLLPIAYRYAF